MKMNMKINNNLVLAVVFSVIFIGVYGLAVNSAGAESLPHQAVTLKPGWNIISVPKVVESHQFSAAETSANFSIFILDPSRPSGWATMADLGQSEFTPLYGYFIYNNTEVDQTLSFVYKSDLDPNEKLFSRTFPITGWYSIGVANPSYAKAQGAGTGDLDNVSSILRDLSGYYSFIIDFTAGDFSANPDSVALAENWQAVVSSDANRLNDLRELKGYAVFINKENALYSGFQSGAVLSLTEGTLNISKSLSVVSQNIAVNLADQVLGGFDIETQGEPVSVSQMIFRLQIDGNGGTAEDIKNISLRDENGSVVAGPVDAVGSLGSGTITFTDTVTFPIGKHNAYTLKGKLTNNFVNNQTITVSTNPVTEWSNVRGQTTGKSIIPTPNASVAANTMTVKAAAVTVSVSASPVAQTVIAGAQGFTFANYIFDATASGEDVRFNSLALKYTHSALADYLTGCQLFDGSTALNTGGNIVNPSSSHSSGTDVTFTLDNGLIVTKGTTKTIALKCNIAGNTTSGATYAWGMSTDPTGTGVTSGQSASITQPDSSGQIMTIGSGGTLTVALDSSSPSYSIAAAGSTNVPLAVLKFSAANEAITLTKVALQLSGTASNSPSDLVKATLWDGSTQVGEVSFVNSDYATSTLTGSFVIPKDGYKLLTIKGDLAAIGTSEIGHEGSLIKVDYDGGNLSGTQGTGNSSGTTINSSSSSDTSSQGVRVFKSYPVFAKLSVPSTNLVAGTMDLYRFSITANPASGNGIGLYKLTVNIATSTGSSSSGYTTVTQLKVYAYTDSGFSVPVSGYDNGQIVTTISTPVNGDNAATLSSSSVLQIPAGSTYYFKVTGLVTLTAGSGTFSGSITTKISGDSSYPSLSGLMGTASDVSSSALVWSPNATTTSAAGHLDWTNGYYVSGLPSDGMDSVTIWK